MFTYIQDLLDRHAVGEISDESLDRLLDKYTSHVQFFDSLPTVKQDGKSYKVVEAGPGTRKLRVA